MYKIISKKPHRYSSTRKRENQFVINMTGTAAGGAMLGASLAGPAGAVLGGVAGIAIVAATNRYRTLNR